MTTTSPDSLGPEQQEGSSLSDNPAPRRPPGTPRFKFECASCGKVSDDASSTSEDEAIRRVEAKGWRGRGDPTSPYKVLWVCPSCSGRVSETLQDPRDEQTPPKLP